MEIINCKLQIELMRLSVIGIIITIQSVESLPGKSKDIAVKESNGKLYWKFLPQLMLFISLIGWTRCGRQKDER